MTKTQENITHKRAKRSGDHKDARNVKVNFLPITQSLVCSGSVHQSLLLRPNLLSGILVWNPLLRMFLHRTSKFTSCPEPTVCSCSIYQGNLHTQSPLSPTCLLSTSRLLTFLEPTLSCSPALHIKVTFILLNPLAYVFFLCTSRLLTFLKPTL